MFKVQYETIIISRLSRQSIQSSVSYKFKVQYRSSTIKVQGSIKKYSLKYNISSMFNTKVQSPG
jgi:hypothetical protein